MGDGLGKVWSLGGRPCAESERKNLQSKLEILEVNENQCTNPLVQS